MSTYRIVRAILFTSLLASLVSGSAVPCLAQSKPSAPVLSPAQKFSKRGTNITPESSLGERLFLETRFAQYFAAHSNGDMNRVLVQGDPAVAHFRNPRAGVAYPSPFAGKSINCRSCHFVDEFTLFIGGANRTYCDFSQRSRIPYREDGRSVTVRNSRNMVDDFTPRRTEVLLHADGEFASVEAITKSVMTGRTFGWLSSEHDEAVRHIAKLIRDDDGRDDLGQLYGGSYAKLMRGTAGDLPEKFRVSKEFRIDVTTASDQQILDEVSRLIGVFLKSLQFEHTPAGLHTGSAYDMFLAKNSLPLMPDQGETDTQYSQRLLDKVNQLQNPKFVLPYERWLRFHPHVAEFGEQELAGLKIFLRRGPSSQQQIPALLSDRALSNSRAASHAGNCSACHPAPDFTDVRFHNTGAAQEEYDSLHGPGSFALLPVPSYEERIRHPDEYLPATPSHPHAKGVFRSLPTVSNLSATDLGVWNIFANPDFPDVQSQMTSLLCDTRPCDPNVQLPRTLALFKTPTLRDLGHSWPYLHTGRMTTLPDVLHYYLKMSGLAKAGDLRNGDAELRGISLDEQDIAELAAFLRALDEDYDN